LFSIAEYPKHRRQVQNLQTTDLREKKKKKKTVWSIVSTGITGPSPTLRFGGACGLEVGAFYPDKGDNHFFWQFRGDDHLLWQFCEGFLMTFSDDSFVRHLNLILMQL
jgi:hypothetical protein